MKIVFVPPLTDSLAHSLLFIALEPERASQKIICYKKFNIHYSIVQSAHTKKILPKMYYYPINA